MLILVCGKDYQRMVYSIYNVLTRIYDNDDDDKEISKSAPASEGNVPQTPCQGFAPWTTLGTSVPRTIVPQTLSICPSLPIKS